ncbi:MAG TPA: acyloxyacyl hydrolase [Thiolapillus brandeum]|uniref:Lipid A deacylase n=1 Tax=Thiolapillus brandeum TaxID=1076588 RepID=A0A831K4L7_9GAMM|nr:acyloxyacyl hydrolase [Thiolapillus brandeum]
MRQTFFIPFILLALLVLAFPVFAVDGISLDAGEGDENAISLGITARWDWDKRWFEEGNWYLSGHWNLGVSYWNGDSDRFSNHTMMTAGLTPVFRFSRHTAYDNGVKPFFELGVGAYVLSDTKFGDKHFGGNFTFSDYAAVGIQMGKQQEHELSLHVHHYSNAGIYSNNPGINFIELRYGHNF